MAPTPRKPHNLPPLSQDAFAPSPEQGSTANNRPSLVRLVVSGSAGPTAVDTLAQGWKKNGFASAQTQLSGIVYELGRADKPEPALEAFSVSNEAPNNIPLTLVHPLKAASGELLPQLLPKDTAPPHAYIAFALPTITSSASLEGENEPKWLAFLSEASQRNLTIELALPDPRTTSGSSTDEEAEKIRESLERVLGKAWDEEVERKKKESDGQADATKGLRIILDALAAPPLSTSSSQLLRSQDLQNWSDFISRLSLHPRVYLKLSPLPLPSLLPPSVSAAASFRAVDAPGLTNVGASVIHSVADAASTAVATAESLVGQTGAVMSSEERRAELLRRLRIFLDTALEAFGEERIIWASYLGSGSSVVAAAQAATAAAADSNSSKGTTSEIEEWFEVVRESLAQSGLSQESMDKVFSHNASKAYLM